MQKFPVEEIEAAEAAVLEVVRTANIGYKIRDLIDLLASREGIDPEVLRDAVWHLADKRKLTFNRDWQLSVVNDLNGHSR